MIWKRLPVPVIAAVHGVAYGGGCQIALGADIRIASPDAKISVMEIKWGLIPDMSLTQTLRDLVPLDVAKELTFSGRVLSGTEAQALGLVTRVADDPLQAALDLAREIAGKSPDAIRAAKQLFEVAWHADPATGLNLEQSLQGSLIGTPNQIEAVKANFEKRAAGIQESHLITPLRRAVGMSWEREVEELERRRQLALRQGGKEAIARQHARGRLTIRERIAALLDADSFEEHGRATAIPDYSADRSGTRSTTSFRPTMSSASAKLRVVASSSAAKTSR